MLRAIEAIGESADALAHEIKNPITAVNMALRAVATELGEDHRAVLADLVGRMERIREMMRSTFSFVAPLEPSLRECAAGTLFDATLTALRSEIDRTGATVRTQVPPGDVHFQGDRTLLKAMLSHLVTNALEAKDRGVTVTLVAEPGADGFVVLAVEDDGPGLPDPSTEDLFQPFVSTKCRGSGLGLAMSRKIAEAHGGSLQAVRGRRQGARLEARLPAGPRTR